MSKHYSNLLAFFILFFIIYACSSDSNEDDLSSLPPNEVGPQYIKENDSIIDFLKNHFYNYEDFQNLSPSAQIELKIDSITGDNSNKIALFEQVTTKSIDILDENDEIVSHNLYYIITRPGVGENPTVADSVFVSYKGILLDNTIFDERQNPVWLDQTSVVRGFQEFTPILKKGNVTINNNGTYSFENFGSGIVIFPSKLGYYERTVSSIPRYSPLIFQINLKTLNKTDHDSDGVDTIDEDLNKDNIFGNDDTDSDGIPNYYDTDDDGDGILTKDELDSDNDGNVDDTDQDGIPDYLDSE